MTNTLAIWNSLAKSIEPSEASKHIQRPSDSHVTTTAYNELLVNCSLPVDEAILQAIITPHAGDWQHAPPLTAVGLRLSEEAFRVASGFRLGNNICQPHVCVCSETVDARGLHSLVCRKSGPRHIRHSSLNDLIWRAVNKTQISASIEPIGLSRSDGKKPDGAN